MKVKKRTLLLLASIVWLIAGFNIIRIGILSYTGHVTVVNILLSALFLLYSGRWYFINW